jgi:hypothetical protein
MAVRKADRGFFRSFSRRASFEDIGSITSDSPQEITNGRKTASAYLNVKYIAATANKRQKRKDAVLFQSILNIPLVSPVFIFVPP